VKSYIVYEDYRIGYIEQICTCEKCKERGIAEIFINDLDGQYLACIKANELENISYFGESLVDAVQTIINKINTKELENKYLQSLIDFYSKNLIK
jgi:hypothetical protein